MDTASDRVPPPRAEPSPLATGGARDGSWSRLVAPIVLLQLLAVGSLALGRDTLFLRDVLATHLPMKQVQAAALRQGHLPELDLQRGGGQPLLGNLNGTPLYPDNVLYVVAPAPWALNAHFWLHFLVAPWSFAWLARRLGCGRSGAWVGGAVYATSGWFLSQMSYANLVAGAALAPAFIAACLAARDGSAASGAVSGAAAGIGARRAAAAAGALWALLLLAGDPATAALALLAAIVALVATSAGAGIARERSEAGPGASRRAAGSRAAWLRLALALACGTALAAPQLVELLRILAVSTRGVRGYDAAARTMASWDPRLVLEQLLPLAFGRLDSSGPGGFWGHRFHTGALPFFLTLYPGVLTFGLVAAAGRARGRGGRFAWAVLALGMMLALGRYDPLLAPLAALPGGSLLRFPVKAWLLVALGMAALAAAGWERAVELAEATAVRRLRLALLLVGGVLAGIAVAAALGETPLQDWMARQLPAGAPAALVDGEARRWAVVAAGLALLAALQALVLFRRLPARIAALAVTVHAAAQLVLLGPATLARDAVERATSSPAFVGLIPPRTRIAHGSVGRLFGPPPRRAPPGGDGRWLVRQGAAAGFPHTGVPASWRYELARSPEGLDGFLTRLAGDAFAMLDDASRVRLLQIWGVEALLIERALPPGTPGTRLAATADGPLARIYVYRIDGSTPEVRRVAGVRPAADPRSALTTLLDPRFDPGREVVLPGRVAAAPPGAGTVAILRDGAEELGLETRDRRPGWLVVERAWQPHWRATVDGEGAPVIAADLHRLAVPVPAGTTRVRLFVDRAPLRRAGWAAALGFACLLGLAWRREGAATIE